MGDVQELCKGAWPMKKAFLHNHGVFTYDCNDGCGWYEVGQQLTKYDPETKKQVVVHDENG